MSVVHEDNERPVELAADAASSAAGAITGLAIGGPVGAVIGAVGTPALKHGLDWLRDTYRARQEEQVAIVIGLAARQADLEPEQLIEHLEANPETQELLASVVGVAQDASIIGKLFVLSKTLAVGAAQTDDHHQIALEKTFVAAVADLDSAHLELLERFTMSANENNLGDGSPEFDEPVSSLNERQLELCMPQLTGLYDTIVARLVSHGLLATMTSGGALGGAGTRVRTWSITGFGRTFIGRIVAVGEFVAGAEAEGADLS